ncbi:MAG: methyltransferase domain-containing protein [Myxococcota bacterium]
MSADGETLDRSQPVTKYRQLFVDRIAQELARAPKPLTALDFACGDGFATLGLHANLPPGSRIVAIGGARDALKRFHDTVSEALRPSLFIRKESQARLPFDNNAFDVAWASLDTQRLSDPRALLRQVMRTVRAPGQVLIATPLRETVLELMRSLTPLCASESVRSLFDDDPTLFSSDEWVAELEKMDAVDVGVATHAVAVRLERPISDHSIFVQHLLPLLTHGAGEGREHLIEMLDAGLDAPVELTVPIACVHGRKVRPPRGDAPADPKNATA